MQKWKKLGKIFEANNNYDWMKSHATCPFSVNLKEDIFRVFFSSRDGKGYSHGGWIDIDINQPLNVLNISEKPMISPDKAGYFGDAGIVPFSIVNNDGQYLLYYSGWTLKHTVPFDFHIGLAYSNNLDFFVKNYKMPILDRTEDEPFLIGAPFVLHENNLWKMWYIAGDSWKANKHYYSIKYAESSDGVNWPKRGVQCIGYDNEYEYAFARPVVLKENDMYKMWYTFRAQKNIDSYRAGYAESNNGIDWIRKDEEVGIDVSDSGWDSEMICYPFVFDHKGARYMLYNGNDYGKTGFGLAILEGE